VLTLDEWLIRSRASCKRDEGQTQAEYGVVLAAITAASVSIFTVFSGGVEGAINRVIGFFPG
jgi:Flp pilus assembly pilin Flp